MTALGVIFMDKSGQALLLLVSAAGTCLGCFLVGLSLFLQDLQTWTKITLILALVGVLYSVFGSIMTIGVMLGAVLSGRIADILGRRGESFANALYMSLGTCLYSINNPQKSPRRFVISFWVSNYIFCWNCYQLAHLGSDRNYSMSCTAYRLIIIPESPTWLENSVQVEYITLSN
ncbi:hypothetical protein CMV_030224 [Castanea mollissima]|uniref:Major facilitator superfamily (MFS) profile domain-containing protein n=1 Tax=Castanea mollissima TaxID=60419 RepID=A0A8J4V6L6_9ROSI|nr:hypothetical protein CMV_030224 [Castanea mollissima]